MRVRWTRTALKNLKDEAEYIARDDRQAASDVLNKIKEAIEKLQAHPSIGRAGRVHGTRELVIGGTPYIIPYRVKEGRVEILRVFHASRKWPDSL